MVSVIIPCYNGARFLVDAMDSVLEQSYSEWECIIADDGSSDNSKEIADSYAKKDSRFRYVYQSNAGPCAARNLGMSVAKGEYFQFLDSDDLIEKEKLKKQVEILGNFPDFGLVYGNMKYFSKTDNGQIRTRPNEDKFWKNAKMSGKGDEIIPTLLHGNIMVVDSPLIRRTVFEKIGSWDTQIWFNEDWDVWTRCAFSGISFRYDDSPNTDALVRDHEESRSKDLFKMFLHGLKVCLKVKKVIKKTEYKRILIPKIYYHFHFLDNNVLTEFKTNKERSYAKSSELYKETQLLHYRIFAWLMHNMPILFSKIYAQFSYWVNMLKSKILYES